LTSDATRNGRKIAAIAGDRRIRHAAASISTPRNGGVSVGANALWVTILIDYGEAGVAVLPPVAMPGC